MVSSTIGVIEALKWTKSSTALDFSKWFKIFECSLIINKIDQTKAEQVIQAKAMLYAYGGDKIRTNCELLRCELSNDFCGKSFPHAGICPAQGHECKHCYPINHTENVCQQKKRELKAESAKTSKSNSGKGPGYITMPFR